MPLAIPRVLGFPVCLDGIPEVLHHEALACLQQRDVVGFLIKADNQLGLSLVARNAGLLASLEMYEIALLHALTSPRLNNSHWPPRKLHTLVARADPKRLRAAGDPLPGPGPYTLYRGVGGRGRARRVHGLSWTSSRRVAIWFANRAASCGLPDPAVYVITVPTRAVLAYSNDRQEEEFLVHVPPHIRALQPPGRLGSTCGADGEREGGPE
jgi:hypothetical protein